MEKGVGGGGGKMGAMLTSSLSAELLSYRRKKVVALALRYRSLSSCNFCCMFWSQFFLINQCFSFQTLIISKKYS